MQILYSPRLEPITVVDIPHHLLEMLMRGEEIWLHMNWQVSIAERPLHGGGPPPQMSRPVRIIPQLLYFNNYKCMVLITSSIKDAMQLKPDFLPGQDVEILSKETCPYELFEDARARLAAGRTIEPVFQELPRRDHPSFGDKRYPWD